MSRMDGDPQVPGDAFKQILRQVDPSFYFSEHQVVGWLECLDLAFFLYANRRANELRPTPKQLRDKADAMRVALIRLKTALPKADDPLFRHISELGERYAQRRGPHPGMPPVRVGDDDEYNDDYKDWKKDGSHQAPPIPPWNDYQSNKRLEDFINHVPQILNWMRLSDSPSGWNQRALNSPATVGLIGADLPNLYEKIFGREFGVSRSKTAGSKKVTRYGPGIRFIIEVLRRAKTAAIIDDTFSPETIIKYRGRAMKLKLGGLSFDLDTF